MGYAVRHFLKHTARSDEEYTLVHEDLETITEGTFEWPGYFYDYDLNKYSKVPGWGVNMGCTVKGMIGIDNYYRDSPISILKPNHKYLTIKNLLLFQERFSEPFIFL